MARKERNLEDVLKKIREVIPEEHLAMINHFIDDLGYKALEDHWSVTGRKVQAWMQRELPFPDAKAPEWARKVGRIWRGEE